MQPQTHGAVSFRNTGSLQGSMYFCLDTGQVIKRISFTELLMPDMVIVQVEKWAEKEDMKGG